MPGSVAQYFTGVDYLLSLPMLLLTLFAMGILLIDLMLRPEWKWVNPMAALVGIGFAAAGVWINDATEMPVERRDVVDAWSFKEPRTFGDSTIDNVFTEWNGNAVLASAQRDLVTAIEADSTCDRLVVYAPAGRDFIAVEPVTHETDAFNRAAAGAQGTGMRVLAPGAAYSCTMRIAASFEGPR